MPSPYDKYKHNRIWKKIEKSLLELQQDNKITISGSQEEVIGHIIKNIIEDDPEKDHSK